MLPFNSIKSYLGKAKTKWRCILKKNHEPLCSRKGLWGGEYIHIKRCGENLQQITLQACEEGEISLIALHSVRSIDSNWKNNKKPSTPGAAGPENDRVLLGKKAKGGENEGEKNSSVQISEIYHCSLKDNHSVPSF